MTTHEPPATRATRSTVTDDDSHATLTARGMLTQTAAIFVDAYRELNAKKLFWITMALSCVIVAAFAAVGFDDAGFSIFGKTFRSPFFNTRMLPKAELYKGLFLSRGVQWWLGFFALILALVSTAPMIPDFLSGGAIDLYLARPLGRTRLFLTKYVVGLLFVSVQVFVFCLASVAVIGVRGGAWVPGLFLAVPVVVLMFSYLWSICVLAGTITRSTIAALLITMVVWFLIFGVHATESALLWFSVHAKVEARELDRYIATSEAERATIEARPAATQPKSFDAARLRDITADLDVARKQRADGGDPFEVWHTAIYAVKWPLPKTTETTNLLERWLDQQFTPPPQRRRRPPTTEESETSFYATSDVPRMTAVEVDRVLKTRSAVWVIGTSLVFEGAMLGLATCVFARRDF